VADQGDPVAAGIVDQAADELALLVVAAVAAASPEGAGPAVPVALGGGLLGAASTLRRRLEERIARSAPSADVRSADGPPIDGAWLLGHERDPGRYRELVYRWMAPGG
jgi:predicted NBD/HSP70 family sugar kinase